MFICCLWSTNKHNNHNPKKQSKNPETCKLGQTGEALPEKRARALRKSKHPTQIIALLLVVFCFDYHTFLKGNVDFDMKVFLVNLKCMVIQCLALQYENSNQPQDQFS